MAHATPLAAREITAAFVTDLIKDTDEARVKAAAAVQHSTATKTATAADDQAAHFLLAAMQEVQNAAKQKHARINRIALDDYFVGQKPNGNRPNLLQTSQGKNTAPTGAGSNTVMLKNYPWLPRIAS